MNGPSRAPICFCSLYVVYKPSESLERLRRGVVFMGAADESARQSPPQTERGAFPEKSHKKNKGLRSLPRARR